MDQFAEGLAVGGVLTMIKQYPDTLQPYLSMRHLLLYQVYWFHNYVCVYSILITYSD